MRSHGALRASRPKLFLPALTVASFACGPITVLAALLLIDIGITFHTSVGVTGQINTAYSLAAFAFALFTGVLSVKFRHKSLLLVGVLLMIASALGCFLAVNFTSLLVFYSLSGAGYAIVNPMIFAFVGDCLPLEKRPKAIGWIVAGAALVYVLGAPIIAQMAVFGNWRFPLLGFVVPVLLASVLMASLGLPSASERSRIKSGMKTHLSFNEILVNRSAVACLIGDALRSAAFVAIVLYATSFFRQRFSMAIDLASLVLLVGAVAYVLGSLSTGGLLARLGRKPSTVLTASLSGILTVLYVLVPNVLLSLLLMLMAAWFFGMVASSANSLTLEQVPSLRGAMMSVDTAAINIGSGFGTVAGGLALLYLNYEGLGSVLGAIGIIAAMIFGLLAIDPTKKSQ
jgi:DHA1 family inner membrane transport protein